MKKLLITLLVLIAAYAVGAVVLAVANGQADGAVLNAEKQILADGDMEKSGTSDWVISGAIAEKIVGANNDGNYILRLTNTATNGVASQNILTPLKMYHLTGWARGDGASQYPRIQFGGNVRWTGTTSNSWQKIDIISYTSVDTNIYLSSYFGVGGYAEFDDLFLTEYTGDLTNVNQQLLADGDMEKSGTSAWTVVQSATLTKEHGAAHGGDLIMRVAYNGVTNPSAQQNVLTVGKKYRITGWARSDGTRNPTVYSGSYIWYGTTDANWQRVDVTWIAQATYVRLNTAASAAGYTEWDDVFITEYTGDMTNANRQLLVDGDMEAADTSDWIVANATLSKESGGANDGDRILRITRASEVAAPVTSPQTSILVPGKTYRITGWARSDGTQTPRVRDTGAGFNWTGTAATLEWQRFDFIGSPLSATLQLRESASEGTLGDYVEFDDVLVTAL